MEVIEENKGNIVEKSVKQVFSQELVEATILEQYFEILANRTILLKKKKYYLEAQAHFFHKQNGSYLGCIPQHLDMTKRQLYFATENENFSRINTFFGESTIFPIPKISNLCRNFGFFCFFCTKYFTSKGCFHRCKSTPTCFACHRPVAKDNTFFLTNDTKKFFCKSSEESFICNICNSIYYSKKCLEFHL